MPIVEQFATPANLTDLNSIPGAPEEWHKAVSSWFDWAIESDVRLVRPGPFQFYNPGRFDPSGLTVEQAVTWNAFPKELLRLYDRKQALKQADSLWLLSRYYMEIGGQKFNKGEYQSLFETCFRPQDEYCEWRAERCGEIGPIQRVTFTSEPPELWFAAFGGVVPGDPTHNCFTGNRDDVVRRYQEFTGAPVTATDLITPRKKKGPYGPLASRNGYNIYNRWNTTHGIVHLCAPPNALLSEIKLGADASIVRKNRAGRLLVEPEALICCNQFGGPNRNSDPTIGATVNAAARLGAFVTLKDPVGLYMDHIDLSGWECPDGKPVDECIHIVRGTPGMIERLVVEVPKRRGFSVSDITIGGDSIEYGGQIAECITVKLIAIATVPMQPVRNAAVQCSGGCYFKPGDPQSNLHQFATQGVRVEAFAGQGIQETPARAGQRTRNRPIQSTVPRLRTP